MKYLSDTLMTTMVVCILIVYVVYGTYKCSLYVVYVQFMALIKSRKLKIIGACLGVGILP